MVKVVTGVVVLAALVAGGWYLTRAPDGAEGPAYSEARVRRGDIKALVSATGVLSPMNTVQVGSQVSGTIQRLYADFNDEVKKGQLIAQIDPAIFKARRAEAAANLKSAQAARDKAWVSVLDAEREFRRQETLFKKKLAAESVLDAARFAYESAQVEHQVKSAGVAQTQAALEREQVNLDYTSIKAPIDGVIISRDVDVGQTVAASLQAPTLFTIANDLTRMLVEADVDEAFIGQVRSGQRVYFTVFTYPRRSFAGTVAQVRLQPKVDAGVVKYKCIIDVGNADLALKPGMTATVSIEVDHRQQVLMVPNAALRFVPDRPDEELQQVRKRLAAGEAVIWRVTGDALVPVAVSTGIIGESSTEVSGEGLDDRAVIAVPLQRMDARRQRRFGLSLF